MKKLILPFFILLLGAYFGYYLVMEDRPVRNPGDTNLVLRVTSQDKMPECVISFFESGKIRVEASERGRQYLTFVGLPAGTDTLRINYYEAGEGYRDVDIPLEYETGVNFQLTVDTFTGKSEYEISYKDYLLGFLLGEGPVNLLRYLYLAAVLYVTWVVFPLIWLIMIYTLIREYRKGLRRRFAGSWVYLGIGCALLIWAFTTPFFAWLELLPDELRRIVYMLMAGYPLYFLAYLVLDEDKVLGAEYRMLDEYFTYEEFQLSEGGSANGFVVSWRQSNLIGVIGWLIGALLLPLSTYMRIILYYVTPYMYGSKTWRELSPVENPGPGALSRLMGVKLSKSKIPQPENISRSSGGDVSPVMSDEARTAGRRRRKRHRPQRKSPYTGQADGAEQDGDTAKEAEPADDRVEIG